MQYFEDGGGVKMGVLIYHMAEGHSEEESPGGDTCTEHKNKISEV